MRLVLHNPTSSWDTSRKEFTLDVPCPTIMGQADSVGGQGRAHWWLEDDGVTGTAPAHDRPPYRIPTMAEIAALRGTNGLTVLSTFSGCGGSCLGFEMAGFRVLAASEFVPAAREVYELNHPGVPVDDRDIRSLSAEEFLQIAGVAQGDVDVMEGSPPCASFSTAGSRSAHWGQERAYSGTSQRSDDLFYEFARLVHGVQPRVFVAENVSGLVKGVAKGYFQQIMERLRDGGAYRVAAKVLDAQWLGVPQARQRVIFVGVRADLDRAPAFPAPLPYRYTLRDALGLDGRLAAVGLGPYENRGGELPERALADAPAPSVMADNRHGIAGSEYAVRVTGRTGPQFRREEHGLDEPIGTVLASDLNHTRWAVHTDDGRVLDPETGARIDLRGTTIEREFHKLRPGETVGSKYGGKWLSLSRSAEDEPVTTVTQSGGNSRGTAGVVHHSTARKFTLGELRRICGFPDDFALTGTYAQRWERLGRAVPPPMMRAVAQKVGESVFGLVFSADGSVVL